MVRGITEIAPFAIEKAISEIEKRNKKTSLHPEKDRFILDAKILARLCRHYGNMKAKLSETEITFYQNVIMYCKNKKIIPSYFDKKIYFQCVENGNNSSIEIIRRKR